MTAGALEINQATSGLRGLAGYAEQDCMSEIMRRVARNRDEQAFKSLFLEYAPRIKRLMMRQGADPETAEEIAQEALLTVWRKAGLFAKDRGKASTWIFTIARNLRIDRVRREKSWQTCEIETELEEDIDSVPPDEAADSRQRSARVREMLDRLPPEQQVVVRLSYLDGMSHGEIADRLGLPVGTIKSRIRLACEKLRKSLGDYR